MRSRLILLLLPAVCVLSCTIEKRLHRPGYHIEFKKRLHAVQEEKTAVRPEIGFAAPRSETDVAVDSIAAETAIPAQEIRELPAKVNAPGIKVKASSVGNPPKSDRPSIAQDRLSSSDHIAHKEHTARAKPKAAVVILAAAWFIVAALLLIAGISLISGSPVWGVILLVLAGIMLFLPLLGIGGGSGKKKSSAGFAPFAPEPRSRYRMKLRPDKDVQRKAVIVFILIVLYVLLAILGVVFGISLISAGTMALGIILLVLGGLMLLIPAVTLIMVAASGEKR